MENDRPIPGTSDPSEYSEDITTTGFPPDIQELYDQVTKRVIGQDRAARKVCRGLMVNASGLGDPGRPIGSFLFSGPTGWGKTELAKELARIKIADVTRSPVTLIQCGKMKESHRVSELVGSPPGYVQSDKPGKLDQFKIDEPHFWVKVRPFLAKALKGAKDQKEVNRRLLALYEEHKPYISFVVIDEVEKAHPDLWNVLLHVIDEGVLEMADGSQTSFANSVVILTCNIGGKEQQDTLKGKRRRMGYSNEESMSGKVPTTEVLMGKDREILDLTRDLIKERFPPELVGRLNENIVVFRALPREQQAEVLDLMLAKVQKRFSGEAGPSSKTPKVPRASILFSPKFKELVLDEGVDMETGMRKLRATVDRLATATLARSLGHGMIVEGDEILVDVADGKPVVRRKKRPPLKMLPPPKVIG